MNPHLLVLMQLCKLYMGEHLLGAHCFIIFSFSQDWFLNHLIHIYPEEKCSTIANINKLPCWTERIISME